MTLGSQITAWSSYLTDPDKEHVRKAKAGDRHAFDCLVKSHSGSLRGYVVMRVGTDSADDILQEVWTAAWVGMPTFYSRSRFKAWVYAIAVNKCNDHLRAKYRHPTDSLDGLTETADSNDAYAKIVLQESIRDALKKLPDSQKEVVELYYYAGLTLPEIAHTVGRNLNTVKYQFYRAHEHVSTALKEERACSI